MGCNCKDTAKEYVPPTATPQEWTPNRFLMNCKGCGLNRMLPRGIQLGDKFELVPCPKCNVAFRGIFRGDAVEEIQ